MAWLRPSGAVATAPAAALAVPLEPPRVEHSAPGLKQALARLPRPGASVLDLGPALASNVAFFNRLGSRLRIFDLEGSLREEGLWDSPAKLAVWERQAAPLLAAGSGERYNLVLAWDLPNYLGRERWPVVARELIRRLAPGGMFHLVARTGKQMPAIPSHFRWIEVDLVREQQRETGAVTPPRFSHGEIERLHCGLAAAKSFLDKHGLQEFLLEHVAELNLPPRAVAELRKPRSHYPG
ncbi:MAG TPA: hypothetical protein VGC00_13110 [Thermoanaerobaculia bacterium]